MALKQVQQKQPQSIFPDFPRHTPMVDQHGRLNPTWHLSLSNLYQSLQANLSNEGWSIPPLSISDQNTILKIYTNLIGKSLQSTRPATPNISGQMIYSIGSGQQVPASSPPYVAPVPKMFIIEFNTAEDPTSTITAASWKTFTVT